MADGVNYTKCTNCHKPVPTASYERHVVFCQRNNWGCDRCGKVVPLKEQAEHLALHEPAACECGATPERQHLAQHQDRDCPLRYVGCDYCGARIRANVKDQHQYECGCKSDPCESCGAFVMRKDFILHAASNCEEGKIETYAGAVSPGGVADHIQRANHSLNNGVIGRVDGWVRQAPAGRRGRRVTREPG